MGGVGVLWGAVGWGYDMLRVTSAELDHFAYATEVDVVPPVCKWRKTERNRAVKMLEVKTNFKR